MISYSVYIIDDEQTIRDGIALALEQDYHLNAFSSAEAAFDAAKDSPPDLVLLDIGLPGMDGVKALRKIKELYPDCLIVMITAFEDVNTIISSMKLGAYDYVIKPLQMDSLRLVIRNALETARLRKEVQALQEKYLQENLPCFIGESDVIQDTMKFMRIVAESPDTPILILGETGTGKELIAGAIHYRSPNFKGPLVTVNCAAIPKELIESELFGYEQGAFSGASASGKKGLIEESANGTLFLDEIGDLSLEAQAKLLRFLEDGEFYRVGGTKRSRVKTRVISATNKDLNGMMEKGLFRRDLYFRLGVIKLRVPSLNERSADIIPIAKFFLLEFSRKFGKRFLGISKDAQNLLISHTWKGNIRELKNIIERGVLVGQGPELTVHDLGLEEAMHRAGQQGHTENHTENKTYFPPIPQEGIDLNKAHESFERFYIQEALRLAGGNESKAARLLNINHHTFRYRRKRLLIKKL
ncbi:sigma-54-dependent Fis family transcriptional regulator [bacterium]|nr:sigma-54-dependent Fis family transcriptional regulator [bacterium]